MNEMYIQKFTLLSKTEVLSAISRMNRKNAFRKIAQVFKLKPEHPTKRATNNWFFQKTQTMAMPMFGLTHFIK